MSDEVRQRSGGKSRSVLALFVLNFVSEVGSQAVAFVIGAYLARVLSPDAFAAWVFATAVIAFLSVLVDGGTEVWGGREVAANPGALRSSVRTVLLLRLVLFGIAAGILILIAFASSELRRWVLIFGSGSLLAIALQTSWAHRALHSAAPAATTLVQRLLMLGLVLLFVKEPQQAAAVTFWQAASELAAALLLLMALVPALRTQQRSGLSSPLGHASVLQQAAPLGASRLLRNVSPAMSALLLGYLATNVELGGYGAAQRLAMVVLIVSAVFNLVTFPAIARASSRGEATETPVVLATLRLLTFLIAPVCFGGVLLADQLLRLTFTATYAADPLPLQLLLVAYGVQSLSDNIRRIMHARGQVRSDLSRVAKTTLATIVLLALLIPAADARGAAAALLGGELLMLSLAWNGLKPRPALGEVAARLATPLLLASGMAVGVIPFLGQPMLVQILLGALMYGGLAWVVRPAIMADLQTIDLHGPGAQGEVTTASTKSPPTPG